MTEPKNAEPTEVAPDPTLDAAPTDAAPDEAPDETLDLSEAEQEQTASVDEDDDPLSKVGDEVE